MDREPGAECMLVIIGAMLRDWTATITAAGADNYLFRWGSGAGVSFRYQVV